MTSTAAIPPVVWIGWQGPFLGVGQVPAEGECLYRWIKVGPIELRKQATESFERSIATTPHPLRPPRRRVDETMDRVLPVTVYSPTEQVEQERAEPVQVEAEALTEPHYQLTAT